MQGVKPVTQRDLGTWDGGQSRAVVRREALSITRSQGCGLPLHGLPMHNSQKTAQILLFYHQDNIFGWMHARPGKVTLNEVRQRPFARTRLEQMALPCQGPHPAWGEPCTPRRYAGSN